MNNDIQPSSDSTKFAVDFQLFDAPSGDIWCVFRSQDNTLMAVNMTDIDRVKEVALLPKVQPESTETTNKDLANA